MRDFAQDPILPTMQTQDLLENPKTFYRFHPVKKADYCFSLCLNSAKFYLALHRCMFYDDPEFQLRPAHRPMKNAQNCVRLLLQWIFQAMSYPHLEGRPNIRWDLSIFSRAAELQDILKCVR